MAPPQHVGGTGELRRPLGEAGPPFDRWVEPDPDVPGLTEARTQTLGEDTELFRSIFSKWAPEILTVLDRASPIGFQALRREIPGVSPRVLSMRLQGFQGLQLVLREIVDSRPPRVHYTLTESGSAVLRLMRPVLEYLRQPPGI